MDMIEKFILALELLDDDDDCDEDSSSSSDEEIHLVLDDNDRLPRKKPRVQNFITDVIDKYNDSEFKENYR